MRFHRCVSGRQRRDLSIVNKLTYNVRLNAVILVRELMKRKLLGLFVVAAGALATAAVFAHDDHTGVAKQRHDLMESMADAMQSMASMARGIQPYDADKTREMAGKIASSGDNLTSLFPEGSLTPGSDALPAIWEDWDRFASLASNLTDAANALVEVADTPPAPPSAAPPDPAAGDASEEPAKDAGTGLFKVGMSCKACHDDFRKEEDH